MSHILKSWCSSARILHDKGKHFDLFDQFSKKEVQKNLELILKSIKLRTRSDAKIGLLLSAGIDSNLIRKTLLKLIIFVVGLKMILITLT